MPFTMPSFIRASLISQLLLLSTSVPSTSANLFSVDGEVSSASSYPRSKGDTRIIGGDEVSVGSFIG